VKGGCDVAAAKVPKPCAVILSRLAASSHTLLDCKAATVSLQTVSEAASICQYSFPNFATGGPLALGATIYTFDIELADADRAVYESVSLRVAQHPSETLDYLVTRMLAYCLEFAEGIGFSKGLSDPDEPAILVRDLTGALRVWVDIGLPEPERLHRASKAAPRVVVYTHKEPTQWAARITEAKIHRGEKLEVFAFERTWLASLVAKFERRMKFSLARSEGEIYLTLGSETLQTVLLRPLEASRG
jgi:uncharacterized protein YaeQ